MADPQIMTTMKAKVLSDIEVIKSIKYSGEEYICIADMVTIHYGVILKQIDDKKLDLMLRVKLLKSLWNITGVLAKGNGKESLPEQHELSQDAAILTAMLYMYTNTDIR